MFVYFTRANIHANVYFSQWTRLLQKHVLTFYAVSSFHLFWTSEVMNSRVSFYANPTFRKETNRHHFQIFPQTVYFPLYTPTNQFTDSKSNKDLIPQIRKCTSTLVVAVVVDFSSSLTIDRLTNFNRFRKQRLFNRVSNHC